MRIHEEVLFIVRDSCMIIRRVDSVIMPRRDVLGRSASPSRSEQEEGWTKDMAATVQIDHQLKAFPLKIHVVHCRPKRVSEQ